LSEAETRRLEGLFRSTDDRKLRDRLQVVLLAHHGRPRQQIAQDLALHRRSVTRWLNASGDGGLDALTPRKPKGKAAALPDPLADAIRAWVIGGPEPGGDGAAAPGKQDPDQDLGEVALQAAVQAVRQGVEQGRHQRRQLRQWHGRLRDTGQGSKAREKVGDFG